jgi:hypothetical protein
MRKTIEVKTVREIANKLLASDGLTNEQKKGLRLLVEDVLHKTGNYKGFNTIEDTREMPWEDFLKVNGVQYF